MIWLDRALVVSPYHLALCVTQKQFKKALKHLGLPNEKRPSFLASENADATAHYFEDGKGGCTAIVCLGSVEGKTLEQIYALLVHEAVHIWQQIRAHLGEKEPSAEFEAYSIQSIAQRLMEAYAGHAE